MEMRKIGSLDVSVVGLGCNNFGRRIDEAATKTVVDAAIDAGVNFFDTADIYGGTKSEEFLSRALGSRRDGVLIATKFGVELGPDLKGASPAYVRVAAENSLRRLGTDRIDLYQIHVPDPTIPIADTLGALDDLVQAGKVREIGCSNFSAEMLREAESAAAGRSRFVSVQNEYSLLKREPENGVLAECERLGIALIPYFPVVSGLLTGKYRQGQPLPEGTRLQSGAAQLTDENFVIVEKLIAFAEGHGHTILDLAISWLLTQHAVASVIAGATSAEQIRANAAAAGWKMTNGEADEARRIAAG